MKYLKKAEERSVKTNMETGRGVRDIIDDVIQNGDEALRRYNERFDGCHRAGLRISAQAIERAYKSVSAAEIADLHAAAANIRAFATAQRETLQDITAFSPAPGITLGHRVIPMQSCCCYVPGGGYPLYSTALMLIIPAKVAGVSRVAACSPAVKGTDDICAKTIVAMDIAGAEEIYTVGGAQAIAAFAYGTESIRPVDIIVGPGNSYVTEAKRQCYGQVGIDFIAGPSEVLIFADDSADAELVAADLLAQSEHDRFAQGILVTVSETLAESVLRAVQAQLETLKTAGIASASWQTYGEIIIADSTDEAVELINCRAPEHLELAAADNEAIAPRLFNYGSLFIGQYTAEVFGDYASGTNHTLPTLGAARYTGGVWVGMFTKTCTHQSFTKEAMLGICPLVERMAAGEGLAGHASAARRREEKWK